MGFSTGRGDRVRVSFRCHADFDRMTSGYLSSIILMWRTLSAVSGMITSLAFSPYHAFGTSLEIMLTALSPVTFHVQSLEYRSSTYSRVPMDSKDVFIVWRMEGLLTYES